MPTFLLPEFVVDLQSHRHAHFARRVLEKTIQRNGRFREDGDDHRYGGVEDAWIRYISRGASAYRVIFIRSGANVYLYRAGEHAIENRVGAPRARAFDEAVPVADAEGEVANTVARFPQQAEGEGGRPAVNRFLRNRPAPEIRRAILSRRNLPHRDIWLVAPFITPRLLLPTADLGKMLVDQAEDGASIALITAPPRDRDIAWLEQLEERDIAIFCYPRLHSKLYCFVLDERRKYERGLPDPRKLSSLLVVGSANITAAGLALSEDGRNEELCYSVPDCEVGHVETYVTSLMTRGYGLSEVRTFRARGQWQRLEVDKW
ncbi:MAG: hypothetical protein F4Y14_06165 [Acidobacteria bacterium]|nr:hypothetical protein [Acidobacteriota bacterium]